MENRTSAPRQDWILLAGRIGLALVFFGAAGAKLAGVPDLVALFDRVGLGQWLRYFTAILEAAGAVLLLVPALTVWGAALLATVMAGAFLTNIALGLNPIGAVVLFTAAVLLGWAQRRR